MAKRLGTDIPHLCYSPEPGYRADGNCRACMVEIEGERVLAASCIRKPSEGMKVKAVSERAKTARQMVFELLMSDQPARETAHDPQSKFWAWADRMNVAASRFGQRHAPEPDRSHPAMAVNLDACIQCNLCVRACREVQVNDVIGMAGRGHSEKIVFDFDDPMGASTCVACGECVQACPTGALMPATLVTKNVRTEFPDREVHSVCPYCGVGCQLTYQIKNDKLLYVTGRDGPANQQRLCVKGRFGFDYVSNPQRLMKPLVRKDGVPKAADDLVDPSNPCTHFREATWDEAMDRAASGLKKIRDRDGPRALAGFGSAKGSNEEAYLFQKLVRTGFGSNNVDHCTRLCHASSVAALLEGVGSAAVTATFNECKNSDFIIVIGANPTENHPVAATFFKQAAKRGAKLVVMDPRGQALQAPRLADDAVQERHRRGDAQRHAQRHRRRKAVRPAIRADLRRRLRPARRARQGFHAGGDGADLRHSRRHAARSRARLRARRKRHHLLGHGRVAAHPRHRQCALPDRAVADLRPGRPARHRPASAARPEQRAGRLRRRPHSDVLPRLQVGGKSGEDRASTKRPGARSSIPSAARPWSRSWTRCTPTRSRACTSWAKTRRCPTPT